MVVINKGDTIDTSPLILAENHINTPLPEQFHSAELRRLPRARPRAVSYVIQVLRRLNLIEQIGVENRFHIYRLTKDPSF